MRIVGIAGSLRAGSFPRVFKARAVGLIGASPGAFGTVLSQPARLPASKVPRRLYRIRRQLG